MSERNSCHMVCPPLGGQPPPFFLWGPFALWVLGMVVNDPGSLGPARLVRQASSQLMAGHGKCRTLLAQKDESSMGKLQGTLTGIAIQVSEDSPRRKGVLEAVASLRSCMGFLTVPGSQAQQLGNTGQSTRAWSTPRQGSHQWGNLTLTGIAVQVSGCSPERELLKQLPSCTAAPAT